MLWDAQASRVALEEIEAQQAFWEAGAREHEKVIEGVQHHLTNIVGNLTGARHAGAGGAAIEWLTSSSCEGTRVYGTRAACTRARTEGGLDLVGATQMESAVLAADPPANLPGDRLEPPAVEEA